MNPTISNGFCRSGMAALSDMDLPDYKKIFSFLEKEQVHFLSKEAEFRSPEYKWPKDSLHCWSRLWEYPYVYYHLKNEKNSFSKTTIRVVDFGSGVTFFPFSIARMGCNVHCIDIDPICEKDMNRAAIAVNHDPGEISFCLMRDKAIPINNNEIDAIYSISVLEHISDFEVALSEIARVLKPNGLFVLTIDIDMCGYSDIGVRRYQDLRKALDSFFIFDKNETMVHPLDLLVQYPNIHPLRQIKFFIKQFIRSATMKTPYRKYPNLSVWGGVFRKK